MKEMRRSQHSPHRDSPSRLSPDDQPSGWLSASSIFLSTTWDQKFRGRPPFKVKGKNSVDTALGRFIIILIQ